VGKYSDCVARNVRRRRLSAEERREGVLDAARALFSQHGYDRASMRDIAEAAGVTVPVLYDHFPSKQALQVALIQREGDALVAQVPTGYEAETWRDFVHESFDTFFRFVEANPHAWRLLFVEAPTDPELVRAQREVLRRATQHTAALVAQVAEWQLPKSIPAERAAEMLAESVRSTLNGLAAWWWQNQEVPREQVTLMAFELLWPGVDRLCGMVETLPEFRAKQRGSEDRSAD
jgi:AcrR family transcriptional regulator